MEKDADSKSSAVAISDRERRAKRREALRAENHRQQRGETNAPPGGRAAAAAAANNGPSREPAASGDVKLPAKRRATRSSSRRTAAERQQEEQEHQLLAKAPGASASAKSTRHRGQQEKRESTGTAVAGGENHQQPVKKQKTATGSAAAARMGSSSAVRKSSSYSLRGASTVRKPPPLATHVQHRQEQGGAIKSVTPASAHPPAVARQINFGYNSGYQVALESEVTSTEAALVPRGVVDVFDERQPISKPVCRCPFDRNMQLDTALSFTHLAAYGKEHLAHLKERETVQMDRLSDLFTLKVLHQSQASPAPSLAPFDGGDRHGSESVGGSPDSGIISSSTLSSTGTPVRGALRRFKVLSAYHQREVPDSPESGDSAKNRRENIDITSPLPRQPTLTPRMRGILVNWLIEVAQEYKMSERTIHLAVSLLDYILWLGPTEEELEAYDSDEDEPDFFLVQRADFQAMGCACAWIASKFEDKSPPSVDDLTYIADHSFTARKLRLLETRICRELNFTLCLLTPLQFVNVYLRASHACPSRSCQFDHPVLREVVMYLLELGRFSYDLSIQSPSLQAAAAVYLARATLNIRESDPDHALHPEGYWTKTLQHYTEYSIAELRDPVLHIYRYQLLAGQSEHFQGVYQKYRMADRFQASLKPPRRIEDLGIIRGVNHDDLDLDLMGLEIFQPSMKW